MARRPRDYYDDDDAPEIKTDMSGVLTDRIDVRADVRRGTVSFFGKEVAVGRDAAVWFNGAIAQAQTAITQHGGFYARKYVTQALNALKLQSHKAAKGGVIAEAAFRYGLPVLDISRGAYIALKTGYRKMNELKQDASVVLAANNDSNVGVGNLLSVKYSALRHERAMIVAEGSRTVKASLASVLKNLPNIIINIWQQKINAINNPASVFETLPKGADRKEAQAKYDALIAMGKPKPADPAAPEQDKVHSTLSRLVKPQSLEDLEHNLKVAKYSPIGAGIISEFISQDIRNKGPKDTAWRRIKALEKNMEDGNVGDRQDLAETIKDIFRQHVADSGSRVKLAGNNFTHLADAIADALIGDENTPKLHAQAIVELLDNPKLFSFDSRTAHFGKSTNIEHELHTLQMKYSRAHLKELWKEMPFTPEVAAQSFTHLNDEEKSFFVMLWPPGALEFAGANPEEVQAAREAGPDNWVQSLVPFVEKLMKADQEELAKLGVKKEYIDELAVMHEDFSQAMRRGRQRAFLSENGGAMKELARNILVTGNERIWTDYVARQEPASKADSKENSARERLHKKRQTAENETDFSSRR